MPINLLARKIYSVLMPDLCSPGDALVITGYSGLDQLIQLINQRGGCEKPLRLILGSDPVSAKRTRLSLKRSVTTVWHEVVLLIDTDFSHFMNSLNRLAS